LLIRRKQYCRRFAD